jgi:hypothetical protein
MITDTPTSMVTRTATDTRAAHARAKQILAAERLRAPATKANAARNARAEIDRHARWAPARDALWQLLDTHMHHDTRVAIVGAGNTDDLPLTQTARRAREVTLLDFDPRATTRARRQQPRQLRRRINLIEHDITHGVADMYSGSRGVTLRRVRLLVALAVPVDLRDSLRGFDAARGCRSPAGTGPSLAERRSRGARYLSALKSEKGSKVCPVVADRRRHRESPPTPLGRLG